MKSHKLHTIMALILGTLLTSGTCSASVDNDWNDFWVSVEKALEHIFGSTHAQPSAPEQPRLNKPSNQHRQSIRQLIKKINPDFLSEVRRIESEMGDHSNLTDEQRTEKIMHSMAIIAAEQEQVLKEAYKNKAARKPSNIKKLYTNEACCVCLESFSTLGTRRYLNPCGHDICPSCHAQLSKQECPQCRAAIKGYEDVRVQADHNPECDEPAQPDHNPELDNG